MPVRAVLDTNALVSAMVSESGAPRQVLDAWLEERFVLVTSLDLVEEFAHVLSYPRIAERLRVSEKDLATLLAALLTKADVTPGRLQLPGATRDPKDDAVVACAKEGGADYVVSGDLDLLTLGQYEGTGIVSPAHFVEVISVCSSEHT